MTIWVLNQRRLLLPKLNGRLLKHDLSLWPTSWLFNMHSFLILIRLRWIIRTNFLKMPMPNVIKETPYYILISIYHVMLWPQITSAKFWELFEMAQNFGEICLHLRHVASRWISSKAFNNIIFAIESINEVSKHHTWSTVFWEVLYQVIILVLIDCLNESNIIN